MGWSLILLLLVVGLVILPIAAFVTASRLGERVDALAREVEELKRLLGFLPSDGVQPGRETLRSAREPMADEPEDAASAETTAGTEKTDETEIGAPSEPATPEAAPEMDEARSRPLETGLSLGRKWASVSPTSRPSEGVERALGTKWTVWVGGLALALGGIFLVRYTIEAGLLGPGVRISLGAVFAVCLAAAGEYVRRTDVTANLAGVPSAYIPGVLTAAGILSGFATVYAAYALYGFLPPLIAFILLAACSIGALSASWLHGPGLAALGLVGSYATPFLVATESPKAWPLFIYLLFVTAASYFVARLKGWLWLVASAAVGAVLWGLLWCAGSWTAGDIVPLTFYILALTALSFYFLSYRSQAEASSGSPQAGGDDEEDADAPAGETMQTLLEGTDWVGTCVLAAITFLVVPAIRLDVYGSVSLGLLCASTLALLAGAWRLFNLSALAGWAAILFGMIFATWHIPALMIAPLGPLDAFLDVGEIPPPALWKFLAIGAVFAAGFFLSGFLNPLLGGRHIIWTLLAAIMPVAIFAYAYLRATRFEQDVPFGLIGLAVAIVYVSAAEAMHRMGENAPWPWRSGVYAASAVVALALAFSILLEKGWLTIALALVCPGIAWVALSRPVPGLRYLAGGIAFIVIARLAFDPVIVAGALGDTPFLNWLLYGYGVPAMAFAGAAWLFRRQKDDRIVQLLEAASILCVVVLIGLQIRHALNDGDVYSGSFDLTELSIHSISMLGLAIGLQRLYDRTERIVVEKAAAILGIAGLGTLLFGHLLVKNPLFTGEFIGEGRLFNLLLLAYVVPALLCGVLFRFSAGRRQEFYVTAIGATALLLLLAWLTLETRALYHGPVLTAGRTGDAEWYTYSAIWLAYGACLLAAGIVTGLVALRYASLAIIVLTIGKVFLSDLSHLSGILRALSFIGLGAVLVAIGYFYQRFVFPGPQEVGTADDKA